MVWGRPLFGFLYIDDGIFVETDLGPRANDCVYLWEKVARKILDEDCINEEKAREEGTWSIEALVLGFIINTETMQIRIPPVKVEVAAYFIMSEEFAEGYKPLTVKNFQVTRGLMTHWLRSCLFWKTCLQPIDAVLCHASEDNEIIQCADPELFKAFWSMFQMLRNMASDRLLWPKLPTWDMRRLLGVNKRFACPNTCKNVLWLTGDATMKTFSCVNWNDKEFTNVPTEEMMQSFNGPNACPPIIADIELMGSISGVAAWAGIDEDNGGLQRIAIIGTDSRNVFSWIRKGKERVGRARRILTAFLLWRIRHGIEAIPFYVRSKHNFSADLITRADDATITAWAARHEMTRVKLPWRWGSFSRFGNITKWSSAATSSISRIPSPIHFVGFGINAVEVNGSNFSGGWIARQYGCNLFCLDPRWHDSSPKQCNLPWWTHGKPDILIGTARSAEECALFISLLQEWCPLAAYLITPSEIVPSEKVEGIWPQHFWIDSSMLGDVVGCMWNVLAASTHAVEILKQETPGSIPGNIENLYHYRKHEPLPGESTVVRTETIANSAGRRIAYKDSRGRETYSVASQLSPFTLLEVQNKSPQWPWLNTGSEPPLLEKLLLMDCHPIWFSRSSMPRNQFIDAVWRTTPINVWAHLLFEILTKWSNGAVGDMQITGRCVTEAPHLVGALHFIEEPHNVEDNQPECESSPRNFDFRVGGKKDTNTTDPNNFA